MGRAGQEVAIPQKRTTDKVEKVEKAAVVSVNNLNKGVSEGKKPSSGNALKKAAASNGENGAAAVKSSKPKVPLQSSSKQPATTTSNGKSEKSKSSSSSAPATVKKAGTAASASAAPHEGKRAKGIRPSSMPPAPESSSTKAHPNNNLSSAAKPKRVKRRKPGSRTDSEIIKYQKGTKLLIQKAPFRRHLKARVAKYNTIAGLRFQGGALHAMQEAKEHYMTNLLRTSHYTTKAFKRVTMDASDILYVRRIRGEIPMEDPKVDANAAMDVDVPAQ